MSSLAPVPRWGVDKKTLFKLATDAKEAALKWMVLSKNIPLVEYTKHIDEVRRAWAEFIQKSEDYRRALHKATRRQERDKTLKEIQRLLERELRRLPGGKMTPDELEVWAAHIVELVVGQLQHTLRGRSIEVYNLALDEISRDTGVQLEFGGVHPRVLEGILRGEGVADTFKGLGREISDEINFIIREAHKAGRIAPAEMVMQMVDAIEGVSKPRLSMIARTETHKVWETARYKGYQEAETRRGETFYYRFGKVEDAKTCTMCTEIMDALPLIPGSATVRGLPLEDLRKLIIQTSKKHLGSRWNPTRDSPWPLPHPNCRHGHSRVQDPMHLGRNP